MITKQITTKLAELYKLKMRFELLQDRFDPVKYFKRDYDHSHTFRIILEREDKTISFEYTAGHGHRFIKPSGQADSRRMIFLMSLHEQYRIFNEYKKQYKNFKPSRDAIGRRFLSLDDERFLKRSLPCPPKIDNVLWCLLLDAEIGLNGLSFNEFLRRVGL